MYFHSFGILCHVLTNNTELLVCNKRLEIKQTKSDMLTIFIYCVRNLPQSVQIPLCQKLESIKPQIKTCQWTLVVSFHYCIFPAALLLPLALMHYIRLALVLIKQTLALKCVLTIMSHLKKNNAFNLIQLGNVLLCHLQIKFFSALMFFLCQFCNDFHQAVVIVIFSRCMESLLLKFIFCGCRILIYENPMRRILFQCYSIIEILSFYP